MPTGYLKQYDGFGVKRLSNDYLEITDIRLDSVDGKNSLTGMVDGKLIFLKVPDSYTVFPCAEFFLGVALLEAMVSNRKIKIDPAFPVSEKLLQHLCDIQSVYACWNSDLKIVPVEATKTSEKRNMGFVGSFFSGGVDSAHTLMRNREQITHLIMLNCFDYDNSDDVWKQRVLEQTVYAHSLGKQFYPIETNAREWTDSRKIAWEFAHGLILATIGGAVGMSHVFIPSSHNYNQLFPWGTHPLTDPIWSTESTQVVHDGAHCDRGEKIRELIAGNFVDNLQVCWKTTGKNCGECPKCVRTMAVFYLLNSQTKALPALRGIKQLKLLKATDVGLLSQLEDTMKMAIQTGNDEAYQTLFGLYRRYQLSQFLEAIDKYILGSLVKKLYRKLKKPNWLNWRVTLTGDHKF